MIIGMGTDIVEMERVREVMERTGPRIAERVLSPVERMAYDTYPEQRRTEFLAGRFAVKEAIAKAVGCGLGRLGMNRVCVQLSTKDAALNEGLIVSWVDPSSDPPWPQGARWHVSISHSKSAAVATAILEGDAR